MTRETETEAMLHAVRESAKRGHAPRYPAGTAIAKEMQPLADQLATVTAARREAGQRIEVLSAQKRRAERQNVTATGAALRTGTKPDTIDIDALDKDIAAEQLKASGAKDAATQIQKIESAIARNAPAGSRNLTRRWCPRMRPAKPSPTPSRRPIWPAPKSSRPRHPCRPVGRVTSRRCCRSSRRQRRNPISSTSWPAARGSRAAARTTSDGG